MTNYEFRVLATDTTNHAPFFWTHPASMLSYDEAVAALADALAHVEVEDAWIEYRPITQWSRMRPGDFASVPEAPNPNSND